MRTHTPYPARRAGVANKQRKFAMDAHAAWERSDKIASLMLRDGGNPWEANPDGD
jgi:hypothetical protein